MLECFFRNGFSHKTVNEIVEALHSGIEQAGKLSEKKIKSCSSLNFIAPSQSFVNVKQFKKNDYQQRKMVKDSGLNRQEINDVIEEYFVAEQEMSVLEKSAGQDIEGLRNTYREIKRAEQFTERAKNEAHRSELKARCFYREEIYEPWSPVSLISFRKEISVS